MAPGENFRTPQDIFKELSKTLEAGDLDKDQSVRRDALRLSLSLTTSLQTPEELAFETCFLPAYSACCRAGVHLRLFEAIAESPGPITASELAIKTGVEQLLIVRLLRIITGLGVVFEAGPETYQALPATHAMTSPMIRAAHQHFWDQGLGSLYHLPSYLSAHGPRCPTDASDGIFQHAFATPLNAFEYWSSQPAPRRAHDNFNFLMTCIRGAEPMWLAWFPAREQILEPSRGDGPVLVDVGGGVGHDVVAFKRRFAPPGRLVLQDLPAVLKDAQLAESEGIERVEHDFFTPQPIKGARVYYYAHILHDWSDAACTRILRSAAPAMTPGHSRLYLYEFILPDTNCSRLQAGFDIQMMGMHAGMERTRSQWTRLLEGAGFRIVKFWMPPGEDMEGIVEAELAETTD